MLQLNRRIGETIHIGDDIVIVVLGINGNQVRIGTIAPKEVKVWREEIYQQIKREQNAQRERLIKALEDDLGECASTDNTNEMEVTIDETLTPNNRGVATDHSDEPR